MRPDLVTFPLPTLSGSAAVPSTLTVLMNGNLVASSQVAAGPFEIPQLPAISGAGTITMTVTNALGQQVTMTQPFYASYRCWPLVCRLSPWMWPGAALLGFIQQRLWEDGGQRRLPPRTDPEVHCRGQLLKTLQARP